jgi:hypothetical protein
MMQPVFIVGCQRSGTTFLGSLLGADPETIAIPEAQFIPELAPADPDAVSAMNTAIDAIEKHYRYGIWNFDLQGSRPDADGSYADAVRWLVTQYAARHGKPDVSRWIDHQPGHVREIGKLREHFPRLKVIHIVRDGRAVAASIMPMAWGPNAMQSAANFWAQRVAMGAALRDYLGEGNWIQVRYEDIVADPETELKKLCAFLGIDFNPAMTQGTGFAVPAFTQNQHQLVGQKPNAARLEAWRRDLSPRQIEIFEALVGPLLTYLGYSRDFGDTARLPDFREKLGMALRDQFAAIRNRAKFEKRVKAFTPK